MGTVNTSAFGIGVTFLNIFCIAILLSLNIGMLINCSKAYGEKNYKLIGIIIHRAIIINIILLVLVTILVVFSESIFLVVGYTPEVARLIYSFLIRALPGVWMYIAFNTLNFYLVALKIFQP